MNQCCRHLCIGVCASMTDLPDDVSLDWHDSLCQYSLHVAQGTRLNQVDVDWAMHDVVGFAKEVVQKANPTLQGPLSSVSTKNTLCDSTSVHAQYYRPHAHAQIAPASFLNKTHQT